MPTCGEIDVQSSFSDSNVTIIDCPDPGTAQPGGSVDVDITIENTNSVDANATVVAAVGTGSDSLTDFDTGVTIPANGTKTITLSPGVPSDPGSYTVTAEIPNVGTASLATTTSTIRGTASGVGESVGVGTLATLGAGIGAAGIKMVKARR